MAGRGALRHGHLFSTILAALVGAGLLLLVRPGWQIGDALDRAGAGAAFAYRRARVGSARVLLVEIDDASIAELGRWPWDQRTIRKLFEAPFNLAELTVVAVSPGDFRHYPEAAAAFWRGISQLPHVAAAFPFEAEGVPLDVIAAVTRAPAGAQGALLTKTNQPYVTRLKLLPKWRAWALPGVVRRMYQAAPESSESEVLARVLDPFWRSSHEVEGLARFWLHQAVAEGAFVAGVGAGDWESSSIGSPPQVGALYLPPDAGRPGSVGFAGAVEGMPFPFAPAVVEYRKGTIGRLAFAAARKLAPPGQVRLEGGMLLAGGVGDEAWAARLRGDSGFIPDWTGNARTAWDQNFFHKVSAAVLVETANARRALWEGYAALERALGVNVISPLAQQYERAVEAGDPEAMIDAERRVVGRMRTLRDLLQGRGVPGYNAESAAARQLGSEALERHEAVIIELENDFQVLGEALVGLFAPPSTESGGKVVVIAPTAREFCTMETPWGRKVPPAAIEVAVINSIMLGTKIAKAPPWAAAVALAAAFALAVASGRFGARVLLVPAIIVTGAAAYLWYTLFDGRGVLLDLSALAALPGSFLAGALCHAAVVGRRRGRVKRLLKGRLGGEFRREVMRGGGGAVLREVAESAVLAVEIEEAEGAVDEVARVRYAGRLARTMLERGAVLVDALCEIEGAFGWTAAGGPVEAAVSSGLSARRHLRLLAEKLRTEGAGPPEVRMGVGLGPGRLSRGTVSGFTLRPSGESFEKARRALLAAGGFGAAMVICRRDLEKIAGGYEVRRLDPPGEYFEVLEKKGALSVTLREIRDLYERALDAFAAGESERSANLLHQALELLEDGPSRALLERIGS